MSPPALWAAAGASHVGRVRTVNEDAWIARPELALFAVADGLGGHARGDLASRMLVEELAAVPALASLGELEPAAARLHPWRNRITRAVGTAETLELERRILELAPGDRVLLCSDGLTGHLEDEAIAEILARDGLAAPAALIEATLSRGARDNVTVLVGECLADDPERTRPGRS